MIVREHDKSFSLVQQHHHGQLAGELMQLWKSDMFPDDQWRNSVLLAIANHDIGWAPFDEQPFWNDEKLAPFSFIDFPVLPKIVLYRQGIDDVEEIDTYAAMLCSLHYEHFIKNSDEKEARKFVEDEQLRRQRLSIEVDGFDNELFEKHFALLQLGDNFSLYCCVNEPGVNKEHEHMFFRDGIPSPDTFSELPNGKIGIRFRDQHTIEVEEFPFSQPFSIEVKQKTVMKKDIEEKGLQAAYEEVEYDMIKLKISPVHK